MHEQRRMPCRVPRLNRPAALRSASAAAPLLLGGCAGIQSALDPAGPDAGRLFDLTVLMTIGGTAIMVLTMGLLLWACFAPPGWRAWLGHRRTIIALGLVFPIVTLSALLPYGLFISRGEAWGVRDPIRIEVVGEQFWWRVRYIDGAGAVQFVTANEVQVPVGQPIELRLATADVIHSFWAPNFAGKMDMIPGRINLLQFVAERPGIYRGQCTEYCGAQHALMAFDMAALTPEDYAAWIRHQSEPALPPTTPERRRGLELFISGGCGNCHAIRGTPANGVIGPDLTHVGSRRTIGAGVFPNNAGTLAGWISDVQHLKTGARMPSYGALPGEDLRAIAYYLEGLK